MSCAFNIQIPIHSSIFVHLLIHSFYLPNILKIIYKLKQNRLEKLEHRASSLVGRAMREIIEKASRQCLDIYEQKKYQTGTKFVTEDAPIESAPLYQKFRGLSYRLRELSALVLRGQFAEALALNMHETRSNGAQYGNKSHAHKAGKKSKFSLQSIKTLDELEVPVINEVKQGYVVMRNELLLPFIKEAWVNSLRSSVGSTAAMPVVGSGIDLVQILEETKGVKVGNSGSASQASGANSTTTVTTATPAANTHTHISLCTGIRQAFSTLLRITQLELQLYESLFLLPRETAGEGSSDPSTPATPVTESARSSPRALAAIPR